MWKELTSLKFLNVCSLIYLPYVSHKILRLHFCNKICYMIQHFDLLILPRYGPKKIIYDSSLNLLPKHFCLWLKFDF
jgi:hypothetical protein